MWPLGLEARARIRERLAPVQPVLVEPAHGHRMGALEVAVPGPLQREVAQATGLLQADIHAAAARSPDTEACAPLTQRLCSKRELELGRRRQSAPNSNLVPENLGAGHRLVKQEQPAGNQRSPGCLLLTQPARRLE